MKPKAGHCILSVKRRRISDQLLADRWRQSFCSWIHDLVYAPADQFHASDFEPETVSDLCESLLADVCQKNRATSFTITFRG